MSGSDFIKSIFLSVLLGYLGIRLSAQGQFLDISFRQISLEKGLSQSNVTAILQDHKGFIWVGTHNGLNRYNAYSFESFGTEDGLSQAYISVLFQHSNGKIWIGNTIGIVDILDPETLKITQLEIPYKEKGAKGILKFYEDTAGKIWIATRNGIHIYDPIEGKFFQFPDKEGAYHPVNRSAVYGIEPDKKGNIWAATQSGLLRLEDIEFGVNQEVHAKLVFPSDKYPFLNSGWVFKIVKSKEGGFWLNAWQKGLIYFEPYSDTYTFYPVVSAEEQGEKIEIYEILEDKKGNVWATTKNHGLLQVNKSKGLLNYARYDADRESSLGSNTLQGLMEDKEGGIWVGTYGAGVNYFHPQASPFKHFKQDDLPFGLSYSLVYEIFPSRYGESVWIGTHGGGLNRMLRNAENEISFSHYLPKPGHPKSLKDDVVITLEEDDDKNLWVGSYHGLSILPSEKKLQDLGALVFEGELGTGPKWDLLEESAIWSLLHDRKGNMWIGTDKGLFRKDAKSDTLIHYTKEAGNPNSIRDYFIRELYEDPSGHIWFPTANGLHRYRAGSDDFYVYSTDGPEEKALSSNSGYCVVSDRAGRIWYGTQGSGLNVIISDTNSEDISVRKFFDTDGLPSNLVMGLLMDDLGQIWASTSRGLVRFYPDSLVNSPNSIKNHFRIYDELDGLQSNEFLEGAFAQDKQGRLYFGGVNGFNEFNPTEFTDSQKDVPVYFTQLKVLNKPVEIGEELRPGEVLLPKDLCNTKSLSLSWKDYYFSIGFSALGYSFSEKIQYAYNLEGLNEAWYYIEDQRTVTFTNLDPGDYVLQVKASNQDGIWNKEVSSLHIHISTPPWKTWWAYMLYFLGILGLILGYIRYRIREREKEMETQIRIEQAKVEERDLVRKNTAADFHDELGNKMTKISLFIELAKRAETANQTLQVYLNQVEENTQNLSQGIRDFIWVLDSEKDSVYDMLIRIKDFGDELFEHTQMDFICEGIHPEQAKYKLPLSSRRNLMLIAKESMNNALKYSEAKTIHFKAIIRAQSLLIEFSDDGKGFDSAAVSKGYGLKNIRSRAEKIGAKSEIITAAGTGTKILLYLDLTHMGD